ncbi:MAG: prolipoprotein diacylglyceryl transferase [Bacteroidales bacterium]|nr:prolipoprotein diacylglyceryl transferase [Bacteroidales bacterium]
MLNDLLGTNLSLPVQTYGFFVALAFLTGGVIIYFELKRREKTGQISSHRKKILKGKPASIVDITISAVVGFIIGFKLIGAIFNYSFFTENPQEYIFSGEGNFLEGIIFAAVSAYLKFKSKEKEKLDKPVWVEETVHPYQITGNIIVIAAFFGILGAKVFDMVEHIGDLIDDPIGTIFSFSGLSFYGGFIFAAFAVSIYAERNKIPWPVIADVVAPALILAYGIGRIGCQMSGDGCWGIPNLEPKPEWLGFLPDWMWAFDYPHNVINEGVHMSNCSGSHCFVLDKPVFPTPFYETCMAVVIFLVLWFLRKKMRIPGLIFSFYLILNGIERFLIEKIRINIKYDFLGLQVTQAEIIAVCLMVFGVLSIFYFRYQQKTFEKKVE